MIKLIILSLLASSCSLMETTCIRSVDKPLIDRALLLYGKGKVSKDEILRDVMPVVVYLPEMQCVGLNLKAGIAGGDTTICFDYNGRHVLSYVSGD